MSVKYLLLWMSVMIIANLHRISYTDIVEIGVPILYTALYLGLLTENYLIPKSGTTNTIIQACNNKLLS